MRALKDVCEGASRFYGNGTVYLSDGSDVVKLREHNFDIESLGPDEADVWVCDGVVVAFSKYVDPREAAKGLRLIIKRMKARY
jgi:hypothetical protein